MTSSYDKHLMEEDEGRGHLSSTSAASTSASRSATTTIQVSSCSSPHPSASSVLVFQSPQDYISPASSADSLEEDRVLSGNLLLPLPTMSRKKGSSSKKDKRSPYALHVSSTNDDDDFHSMRSDSSPPTSSTPYHHDNEGEGSSSSSSSKVDFSSSSSSSEDTVLSPTEFDDEKTSSPTVEGEEKEEGVLDKIRRFNTDSCPKYPGQLRGRGRREREGREGGDDDEEKEGEEEDTISPLKPRNLSHLNEMEEEEEEEDEPLLTLEDMRKRTSAAAAAASAKPLSSSPSSSSYPPMDHRTLENFDIFDLEMEKGTTQTQSQTPQGVTSVSGYDLSSFAIPPPHASSSSHTAVVDMGHVLADEIDDDDARLLGCRSNHGQLVDREYLEDVGRCTGQRCRTWFCVLGILVTFYAIIIAGNATHCTMSYPLRSPSGFKSIALGNGRYAHARFLDRSVTFGQAETLCSNFPGGGGEVWRVEGGESEWDRVTYKMGLEKMVVGGGGDIWLRIKPKGGCPPQEQQSENETSSPSSPSSLCAVKEARTGKGIRVAYGNATSSSSPLLDAKQDDSNDGETFSLLAGVAEAQGCYMLSKAADGSGGGDMIWIPESCDAEHSTMCVVYMEETLQDCLMFPLNYI